MPWIGNDWFGGGEFSWEGAPQDEDDLSLVNRKLTEFSWQGAPQGLWMVDLRSNQLTEFSFEGSPPSLQEVHLNDNWLTKFSWQGAPQGLRRVFLSSNQINNFSWQGAPQGLRAMIVDLNSNRLTKFSWRDAPQGLRTVWLNGNRLTEFSWQGAPLGLRTVWLNDNRLTNFSLENAPQGLQTVLLNRNPITVFDNSVLNNVHKIEGFKKSVIEKNILNREATKIQKIVKGRITRKQTRKILDHLAMAPRNITVLVSLPGRRNMTMVTSTKGGHLFRKAKKRWDETANRARSSMRGSLREVSGSVLTSKDIERRSSSSTGIVAKITTKKTDKDAPDILFL